MAYNSAPRVKKLNALEKVVKKNPKYDYVESTIDTGSSLTKYLKRVEEIKTRRHNAKVNKKNCFCCCCYISQIIRLKKANYDDIKTAIDTNLKAVRRSLSFTTKAPTSSTIVTTGNTQSSKATLPKLNLDNLKSVVRKPSLTKLNTFNDGSTKSNYEKFLIKLIKNDYRYQQNEIFKRMKISTFVQLICQVAEIDSLENESRNENETSRTDSTLTKGANSLALMGDRINENETPDLESARFSTLHGVIHGVGEHDAIHAYKSTRSTVPPTPKPIKFDKENRPYLLVDIRDRDEFNECHIITAYNYPVAMLSRSINNETTELLEFKNQPGKIIVIYDEEEKIGPKAAATMVERGYDNLFLLSGGLKLAVKKFPEGLVTGTLPKMLLASLLKEQKGPKAKQYTEYTGPAIKTSFDRVDIEKLNQYLEESLIAGDTGSRLSRATTLSQSSSRNTVNSNVSNTSKATSIHSQPWKPV